MEVPLTDLLDETLVYLNGDELESISDARSIIMQIKLALEDCEFRLIENGPEEWINIILKDKS